MTITTAGLDLAKNVFEVLAVDENESLVACKRLRPSRVIAFFAESPPSLVGMEACGYAHYWAREWRVR